MADTLQLIQLALTFCLGLFFYFMFTKYYPTYFSEKGKNLATKEDIADITDKIERVKGDINLLTHQRISIATEKQSSLLDFHAKYFTWLNFVVHASAAEEAELNKENVRRTQTKLDELFHDFLLNEARLEVFFEEDDELLQFKNKMKIKTIEMENKLRKCLLKIDTECDKINVAKELTDHDYKMRELDKYYGNREAIHTEFMADRLKRYKELSPMNREFTIMVRKRLDKLVD